MDGKAFSRRRSALFIKLLQTITPPQRSDQQAKPSWSPPVTRGPGRAARAACGDGERDGLGGVHASPRAPRALRAPTHQWQGAPRELSLPPPHAVHLLSHARRCTGQAAGPPSCRGRETSRALDPCTHPALSHASPFPFHLPPPIARPPKAGAASPATPSLPPQLCPLSPRWWSSTPTCR